MGHTGKPMQFSVNASLRIQRHGESDNLVLPQRAKLVDSNQELVDEDVALINSVRIRAIDKTESSQMVYLSNHPREGHRIAQMYHGSFKSHYRKIHQPDIDWNDI